MLLRVSLVLVAVSLLLAQTGSLGQQQLPVATSSTASNSSGNKTILRYELKFQNELSNSTTVKRESQQQVFKCQVRLAPISSNSANSGNNNSQKPSRLKTNTTLSADESNKSNSPFAIVTTATSQAAVKQQRWPTNVTITIDWFKDDQHLIDGSASIINREPIAVINVELKSNSSQRNDKRSNNSIGGNGIKPRIEIKNTVNGSQLKLTSRLKLSQLKSIDSGQYKCIARASFKVPLQQHQQQLVSSNNNNDDHILFHRQQKQSSELAGFSSPMALVDQMLESSGAILVVTNSSSAGERQEVSNSKRANANDNFHANPKLPMDLKRASHTSGGQKSADLARQRANEIQHAILADGSGNTIRGGQGPTNDGGDSEPQIATSPKLEEEDGKGYQHEVGSRDNNNDNELDSARLDTKAYLGNKLHHFEDDEDLFRMESEFSSGQQQTNDELTNAEDEQRQQAQDKQDQFSRHQSAGFDDTRELANGNDGYVESAAAAVASNSNNESSSSSSSRDNQQQQRHSADRNPPAQRQATPSDGGPVVGDRITLTTNQRGRGGNEGVSLGDNYFSGSLDSTRLRLAKFVHKIAPELSCYTGNGDHYRGNVSTSFDGRQCLNWQQVRRFRVELDYHYSSSSMTAKLDQNHNYCRNPNSNPRGPWCYVQYLEQLDGDKPVTAGAGSGTNAGSGPDFMGGPKYVQRQCSISPCSEYLWLYIVAPPLGLLILLSCLAAIMLRSVRKSRYNAMFANNKRRTFPIKINKLFMAQQGRFGSKKFGSSATKKKVCGSYLDDDIFEIVDELDWSDGNQSGSQSLSPKSAESLKLSSPFTSSVVSGQQQRQRQNKHNSPNEANSRKPTINQIFNENAVSIPSAQSTDLLSRNGGTGPTSRSVTQVGPMFATLRCHIKGSLKQDLVPGSGSKSQATANKFSSFIERCGDSGNQQSRQQQQSSWSPESSPSSSSSFANSTRCCNGAQSKSMAANSGGHLISCSNTTDDIESLGCGEKFIKAAELPLLNATTIVDHQQQQEPIYEGKFSQVRVAFIKQLRDSSGVKGDMMLSIGHIGTQVAICSLKTNAAIDPTIFQPSTLKLRNLNHLNILKLIGYAETSEDEIGLKQQATTCSLIYDMAQLVDLSDWLKQQNKDSIISSGSNSNNNTNELSDDLGTRRNLTCFAKQIALALDYLHDLNIVYKDLACRNCFLDPTKMLVKLASFNVEFLFNQHDEKAQNLKSMIRPKYLLDYYVIDSRPSDCQLLPLSWIPLESILFNKFNKQTDIWSFGCLIYELFSLGEVAYFGYSSKQVIDAVRSNLMPPQPLLCPNGIYKLMCKCLSDIPTHRPDVKQIYEQLNLYSGQCSSFLDHHLCSLATSMYDDHQQQLLELKAAQQSRSSSTALNTASSITKTKSYANIRNYHPNPVNHDPFSSTYNNIVAPNQQQTELLTPKPEATVKIPLSRSINLGANQLVNFGAQNCNQVLPDGNHYDEPVIDIRGDSKEEGD